MSDYKKQLNIRPNFHEAIFVNFVLFMSSIKWHSVFGFMVTLILSFMIASNIESYRNPDSVNFLRESLLTSIEAQSTDLPDPNLKRVYKNFMEDIEANLIEVKYKKVSLFRMIGCIVALIGGIFLRKMKQIGLHLFILRASSAAAAVSSSFAASLELSRGSFMASMSAVHFAGGGVTLGLSFVGLRRWDRWDWSAVRYL